MHALWDGLLGGAVVEADLTQRAADIKNLPGYQQLGEELKKRAEPYNLATWLAESREAALQYAYTSEVLRPLEVAFKAPVHELMPLNFSPTYSSEPANWLAPRCRSRISSGGGLVGRADRSKFPSTGTGRRDR